MANGIYSRIPEEKLRDILQTFHDYTLVPIQLIDHDGSLLLSFGKSTGYCSLLKKHVFSPDKCFSLHVKAGEYAQKLGEAYIFSCHANLNHIAFPLVNQGELLGCVIFGPFLMDTPDSTLVSEIAEQHQLSPALSLELYDELTALKIIPPSHVHHLKKMMDFMLSPLIQEERVLLLQSQKKLYQQSRINETIQTYKGREETPNSTYLYQKEKDLLAKVRTGNIPEVKALLNDLLGFVLFSQGGSLESVRIHSIELTTLLSRVAMEGGANADSIYALNSKLLPAFYQENDLDELCLHLQEVAENFMAAMFSQQDKGNLYIRKALRYMANHYNEHLSLPAVADYVQLSPSYFSSLFSQIVGCSFSDYLCRIRIEESKQLLLSTNYSLANIAVAVGFPDQSYFCKAFKRMVGLTPSKFRS